MILGDIIIKHSNSILLCFEFVFENHYCIISFKKLLNIYGSSVIIKVTYFFERGKNMFKLIISVITLFNKLATGNKSSSKGKMDTKNANSKSKKVKTESDSHSLDDKVQSSPRVISKVEDKNATVMDYPNGRNDSNIGNGKSEKERVFSVNTDTSKTSSEILKNSQELISEDLASLKGGEVLDAEDKRATLVTGDMASQFDEIKMLSDDILTTTSIVEDGSAIFKFGEDLDDQELIFSTSEEPTRVTNIETNYQFVELSDDDIDTIVNVLGKKLENNKLIGYDLLQIAGNEEYINKFHTYAIKMINLNYSRKGDFYGNKVEILISLILIAMDKYDGNYWDHVHDTYDIVYKNKSKQKIDGMLRALINDYSHNEKRIINFVIRQTITPKLYMDGFIDFCYDLYINIFKMELVENLNDYLKDVYLEINDNDNITQTSNSGNKTYQLIKTTKEIVENTEWFSELIVYSGLILKYIDQIYWNNNYNGLDYQDYLVPIFETWREKNGEILFRGGHRSRGKTSSWSPSLHLKNGVVNLDIPNHLIKSHFDPSNIRIEIINNDKLLETIERPFTKKVMGGYMILKSQHSVSDPLGLLQYRIMHNEEQIYTSENKLHRNYILFNQNDKEIFNNTDYEGDLDICAKDLTSLGDVNTYFDNGNYMVGNRKIQKYDILEIGSETIFFSSDKENHLQAQAIKGVSIEFSSRSYQLYRKVDFVTLLTTTGIDSLVIENCGNHYRPADLDTKIVPVKDRYFYHIVIDIILVQGFNHLKVFDRITGEFLFKKVIFLDKDFLCSTYQKNGKLKMNLNSVLTDLNDIELNTHGEDPYSISFYDSHFDDKLDLVITPDHPVYRIDEDQWSVFSNYLSIVDIDVYSKIRVEGIDFEQVVLIDSNNKCIANLESESIASKRYVHLGRLKNYELNEIDFASISFIRDDIVVDSIKVYYKVVIDSKTFGIRFEETKMSAHIEFDYFGKDNITIEIKQNNSLIHSIAPKSKPVKLDIGGIESFKDYDIAIFGGEDDIFAMTRSRYILYQDTISFYSSNGMVDREFNLDTIWGERYLLSKDVWQEDRYILQSTRLLIEDNIGDDLFRGKIIFGSKVDNLAEKEVQVELTSDITKGKFWCAIKEDDDFLLFDDVNNTVVFHENCHTRNNMPISEYEAKYQEN